MEDMLLQTLGHSAPVGPETAEAERLTRLRAAADRIRELRQGVKLERPAGMSLREYAHQGHKY